MCMSMRDKYLLRKFGITQIQWDALYKLQKGRCPICDKSLVKPSNNSGKRASPVDHDHKPPNRVRGITCLHCNRFKIAKNDAHSAKRLVKYLTSAFDGRDRRKKKRRVEKDRPDNKRG